MKLDFKIVSFLFLKSKYDFQFFNKMNFTYPAGDLAALGNTNMGGGYRSNILSREERIFFKSAVGFYNH